MELINSVGEALYLINKLSKKYRDAKRSLHSYFHGASLSKEAAEMLGINARNEEPEFIDMYDNNVYKNINEVIYKTSREIEVIECRMNDDDDGDDNLICELEDENKYLSTLYELKEAINAFNRNGMFFLKLAQNNLYELKTSVLKRLNCEPIEHHVCEGGEIRPMYRIDGFLFHGEPIDDNGELVNKDAINAIDLINSDIRIDIAASPELAVEYLEKLVGREGRYQQLLDSREWTQ